MSSMLRPNRALTRMREGKVVVSVKLNLADPRVIQIAGLHGFDCVWLDAEHVPNSISDLENGVRAAYATGIEPIVRVPRGSYSDMVRPLEMDAAGIMVPHVMSAEDARSIVRTTRFHPLGMRPMDGGNADGAFCMADLHEYMRHANEQKMVIAQIEDVEALDAVEEIASVAGIDMLFFGPGDFSQSLGKPGQYSDPAITDARHRVAEVARRHGKLAGTVGSPAVAKELIALGYQFINIAADVIGLGQYFAKVAADYYGSTQNERAGGVYR